jgi:putative oxidoreductase
MLSILRIVAGAVFITFGTMKLFNHPPLPAGMAPFPLMSQMGLASTLEIVGGFLILIGLLTRPVSFVLAGEMAIAYFQGHYPKSFWPSVNMGTPAILYCFIYLYFVFAGGGPWSVDAMIARSKGSSTN